MAMPNVIGGSGVFTPVMQYFGEPYSTWDTAPRSKPEELLEVRVAVHPAPRSIADEFWKVRVAVHPQRPLTVLKPSQKWCTYWEPDCVTRDVSVTIAACGRDRPTRRQHRPTRPRA
eukprot:6806228-Prymnesium_polylepis.1